ncbi:STM3941 family protein [Niallia oryzisoli]|uniref:STM3941 family protein n=1 Tax=Niallia oryzisoli TaxID=1737571 RepID=A0ABZ2CG09_9BACI
MNETNQYVVYPDKVRSIISIAVYLAFVFLEAYILFTSDLNFMWNILLVILMAFLLWQVYQSYKTMLKDQPLLEISDKGIRDYTSSVDLGLIPWKVVEKIETYPGQSSLQIGIVVSKPYSFQNSSSKNAKKIADRNRQRTGYALSIDGFSFRNKKLKEIFHKFKEYGQKNNPAIIFNEYEDPLIKLAKKNKKKK